MTDRITDRGNFVKSQEDNAKTRVAERILTAVDYRSARKGRASLTIWLDPSAVRQFKALAFNLERTQQGLMAEALNELFKKNSLPEIA